MKYNKRFFAAVMSLMLAVSCMGGCGRNEDEGTTIKIGGIGPLTGSTATYGYAVKNGAELAVEEINAQGGINGYPVEFKFEDDENDTEKAVNAYNSLKDWGLDVLVGTVTSNPCVAVAAKTHEDNMFMITPSGTSLDCIVYDNAFRLCFSDPAQGVASADYIYEHGLGEKIAIIYDSSDVYSSGIYQKFKEEAEILGLEIVAEEAFTSDSKTDFKVQLQKARDRKADLIFLPIYYQEAALILQQADEMDYDVDFFGCDGLDGILNVKNFDYSLAEDVMLLTPFTADSQDELSKHFVAAYAEKFNGEVPIQFAADAYDAVYAIKEAMEHAGVTPDMSVSEMCDLLKVSMTEIELYGVTGSAITWGEDGEPDKEPKGMIIKDGEYKAME